MTTENVVALAVIAVFAFVAYRVRSHPGGPLMFRLQHPRLAVVIASTFFAAGAAFVVGGTLRGLPPAVTLMYRDYLWQVGTVGLVCGLLPAVIGVARGPRNAREAAADFADTVRFLGGGYMWLGVAVFPLLAVVAEWFNPVPSARFGTPAIVAIVGFLAPPLVVQAVRAFFFTSTLPAVPEVAAALADVSADSHPHVTLRDAD